MNNKEAIALIEKEKMERLESFKQELKALLNKHNCALVPYAMIEGQSVRTDIKIIAGENIL